MTNYLFLFFMLILSELSVNAQTLQEKESELLNLLSDLRSASTDNAKNEANKKFKSALELTIKMSDAFEYPFDRLTSLGSIKSPDNKVRLFNWNIEQADMTQKYYCYILHLDEKKKEYQTIELIDNSFMLPSQPTEILEAKNWYGALYYKIIPVDKGSKTVYTLLGWDGNSEMSTIKLMDVLSITGSSIRLGSPIFKVAGETKKRVFFEHSKKCTMYLNYDDKQNRIVMDHLSPESPSLKGIYSFYVPDLSYDAFELKGNKWVLKEDVIGTNSESTAKITIQTEGNNGDLKTKVIKNKWEDPTDLNAPGGGSKHVATTFEQEDGINTKGVSKKKSTGKKVKNKGRQPKSYNPVDNKRHKN